MKNGWSIAVAGKSRAGSPQTRHYLVAVENEYLARETLERFIGSEETIVGATMIETRHLTRRNMAENDVFELGGR